MDLILNNSTFFLMGLAKTFQLAVTTLFFATIFSVFFGIMSVTRYKVLNVVALVYVELFRDIPLLVNVLFVYFGAPLIGIPLDPFAAATVSFSLWGGANGAEIVRGGFSAVSRHQRVSAVALGLKPWEIFWFVLGPQALLPIIPPFTGLFGLLIQATSLASMVGAMEFFRTSQIIVERTTLMEGHSPAFLIYGFVLVIYFIICASLAAMTRKLERRLSDRRSRVGSGVPTLDQRAEESI